MGLRQALDIGNLLKDPDGAPKRYPGRFIVGRPVVELGVEQQRLPDNSVVSRNRRVIEHLADLPIRPNQVAR